MASKTMEKTADLTLVHLTIEDILHYEDDTQKKAAC